MIHISGFEEFTGERTPIAAMVRAGYTAAGDVTMVGGRFASGIATRTGYLARSMAWNGNKFSAGFAHQFSARGSVASLKIGTATVVLWMNPDTGLPAMNAAVGGALPTTNRWYYYEFEIDRAGTVSLFINNRFDSSINVGALAGNQVELALGYTAPAIYRPGVTPVPIDAGTKTYDDFYMRDGARIGPIAVTTRFPSVDVKREWFSSDPVVSHAHAQVLSLHPPLPLDNYVASANIGSEDSFTSIQPLANENAVVATGVIVLARKSPSLDAKLDVFIGGESVDDRHSTRTVDTTWETQYVCFEAVGSDTAATIRESEFGFNVAAP